AAHRNPNNCNFPKAAPKIPKRGQAPALQRGLRMNAQQYVSELIRFDSVSSKSNVPVTDYAERALKRRGSETERLEYDDAHGVRKACVVGKLGQGTGGLAYFGHTDVVPASPWFSDEHGPFEPTIQAGRLYGRGSCDMKGSVACMLAATERVRA